MVGLVVAFLLLVFGLIWLIENPSGWIYVGLGVAGIAFLIYSLRKQSTKERIRLNSVNTRARVAPQPVVMADANIVPSWV